MGHMILISQSHENVATLQEDGVKTEIHCIWHCYIVDIADTLIKYCAFYDLK